MEILKRNLAQVEEAIQKAATKAGRSRDEIKLIAVTKSTSVDVMRDLYDEGIRVFAENRTDQLLERQEALGDLNESIEWHFVGRLQSRKVKDIVNRVAYIHSLDRLSLAKEINKRAEKTVQCFLQVNVSQEETKTGVAPEEVKDFIEAVAQYPKVRIVGLMTMAPYDATETELRSYFKELKTLQTKVAAANYEHAPCQELSMGMSQDYPLAIEEGATMIRLGRILFKDL